MYLKDVMAKHLIEEGPEFKEEELGEKKKRKQSYTEEQEEMRKAFLDAIKEAEGNEEEDDIDEEEVEDLLREDDELEQQELYETKFRHEEEVDDRVMGHSRKVEGSVRKKENARKEQRVKIAELERQEELKHLKNLKKKEMKERMKKVMAIAGFKEDEDLPLNLKDLDDEFDPDEYDKMMKAVFGDKYYDNADVDPEFGFDREGNEDEIEKPDFDKEDELLGLPKGWDDTIGDLKTRFKHAKLAPYREKEWKVPDVQRYQQKLKTKELLQGQKSDDRKKGKRKRSKSNAEESTSEMGAKGAEKAQLQEPDTDMDNLSKRAKTRRRQAKPKLSQSRLIAYGKIPSKSKSKVKH
ncbi:hypothetical protein EZV62_000262 [Acer yangbiense]|uniref:Kri1-like C-terminal domain-containing protein n=1 Tax=Acer yangbiense TaxID=1000413 RepID=A0A5C7IQM1_9ROSI|nr:hypothetical protein EZV62_000262 [Acer yangbiense]